MRSVVVQVTKDPIGHKGARLTSQVSLPGRYLVYVTEGSMTGISRKLPDTERARLKTILKKIVPRTRASSCAPPPRRERGRAAPGRRAAAGARGRRIKKRSQERRRHRADAAVRRAGHDVPGRAGHLQRSDFTKVVVQSVTTRWETIHGYVSHVAPDLAGTAVPWTSEVDVFATYRIDEQLAQGAGPQGVAAPAAVRW
ncbi:hypothetical protein GCM10023238_28610 [Streptomyces heliomycini]